MADTVYLAFRIAQLISSFRRRIKTRVLSKATSKTSAARLRDGLSEEFEKEVLDLVAKRPSRRRPNRREDSAVRRAAKRPPLAIGDPGIERRFDRGEKLLPIRGGPLTAERLIAELDSRLSRKGCSILDLATDNKLFLSRWYEVDFSGGVSAAAELRAMVESLLRTLTIIPWQCAFGDKVICSGREVTFDLTAASNLEHILLCLQNDLLKFLLIDSVLLLILGHIIDCQREQSRRCETWFFEFPDGRHPTSTTWPWSIRPSLAVIWGVCWMFYYHWDLEGNIRSSENNKVVMTSEDFYDPRYFWCAPPQARASSWSNPAYQPPTTYQPPPWTATDIDDPRDHSQADQHINGYHATQPRTSYVDGSRYASALDGPSSSATSSEVGSFAAGVSDNYGNPSLRPQGLNLESDLSPNKFPYITPRFSRMGSPKDTISPSQPPAIAASRYTRILPMEDTKSSSYSAQDPLSSVSPKDSPNPRKWTSQNDRPPMEHERYSEDTLSPTSLPPPHRNRNPEITDDGRYACTTCHQLFVRRCEWNKHMDKHERPYKCEELPCAKLLGFTYTGGLLRHQREVHGMHGGLKEKLFCPITHCKRHKDQGFTRKENLFEHLRRVHKQHDPSVQHSDAPEDAPTPASRVSDNSDWSVATSARPPSKRKRDSPTQSDDLPEDGLKQEIKRLKDENSELKDMYQTHHDQMAEMRQQLASIQKQQHQQKDGGSDTKG